MRKYLPWLYILSFLLVTSAQAAVLENNYIKIIVNDGPWDTGRFTLETTGGDPARLEDDFQELLFGGADPWSSYTTIRIDGTDYVFGGPTQRRAGFELPYGEQVARPQVIGGTIQTTYRIGPLEVTQILSIVRSNTTGLDDTMQIQYRVINKGSQTHRIGIRLLLDTKLGMEDGAPIRLGEQVISTETALGSAQIPEFWQAFDNLEHPQVIAQGTLRGGDLTAPNAVLIANWGTLADKSWHVPLTGQGFIREGEDEPDTAFALFWEGDLAPGQAKSYTTHYGLGGVTISRGRLSLGVTSPREVIRGQSFKIIAYIENIEQGAVENGYVRLELPGGFSTSRSRERKLGKIEGGRAFTVEWTVFAGEMAQSGASYKVTVGGDNCQPVTATRQIKIVGPPRIVLNCVPPTIEKDKERWVLAGDKTREPIWIFPLKVEVANRGDSPSSVEINCRDIEHVALALTYDRYKFIGTLEPGQSYSFIWYFAPQSFSGATGKIEIVAKYMEREEVARCSIYYPKLNSQLFLKQRKSSVTAGDTVGLDLWVRNASSLGSYSAVVLYDPQFLEPVSISRGTAVRGRDFNWQQVGEGSIRLEGNLNEQRDVREDTLATLYFKARVPGLAELKVIPVNPVYPQVDHIIKIEEASK